MKPIKIIFLFLFIQSLGFSLTAQEETVKQAETAYVSQDYGQAIELYEKVLQGYGDSFEMYYNLANAYYKAGKMASAILNYERALLLNPGDGDARFNLELAKLRTTDKIEPIGEFFLVEWFRSVQNLFNVDTWATAGILCFVLFIGCLILFFFSKWMRLRKIGFYAGILLLLLVMVTNIFAWNQKKALIDRRGGIIFAPTVTIKSSPDASGTDLFLLHEGTKVYIKSTLAEWYEIELEDGNVGWVRQKDLEKI